MKNNINLKKNRLLSKDNKILSANKDLINRRINIKVLKKRKGEISNIYANNYLLKKKLNWKPKYQNMILSIKRCLKWEKKINNV